MLNSKKIIDASAQYKLSCYFLTHEMAIYSNYLLASEKPINDKIHRITKRINNLSNETKIFDIKSNKRRKILELKTEVGQMSDFLILLRQSFIAILYSFLEISLLRECFLDSRYRDNGKSYNKKGKKNNNGITKAKNYYIEVMKIDFPFTTDPDWLWITKLKMLRDCIVHRQGSITGISRFKTNQELVKFVNSEEGLKIIGGERTLIYIDEGFGKKAVTIVERLIRNLLLYQYKLNK